VLQAESASRSTGPFNRLLAPNILAGSDANSIWDGVLGATISGGGETVQSLGPGIKYPNIVSDDFGTIGGGFGNRVGNADTDFTDAQGGTIGGGQGNLVIAGGGTIGGGQLNIVAGTGGTIGGGGNNAVSDFNAVIAGGANNIVVGNASVIGG